MSENRPNYYLEHFNENSEKVRENILKDTELFHKVDHLSSFQHNLVVCIKGGFDKNEENIEHPYFEKIILDCFLEIAKESESFICLLINGFYDSAAKSLRNILENFIIHYYFSMLEKTGNLKKFYVRKAEFYKLPEQLSEEDIRKVKEYEENKKFPLGEFPIYKANAFFCWKQGKQYLEGYNFIKNKPIMKDYPKFSDCLDFIFKQPNLKKYVEIKNEILVLYKELSKILHNRGTISKYNSASSFLNNSFDKEDLENSIKIYRKIEELSGIMLLLGSYPHFNKVSFTYIPRYKNIKEEIENDSTN